MMANTKDRDKERESGVCACERNMFVPIYFLTLSSNCTKLASEELIHLFLCLFIYQKIKTS